MIPNTSSKGAWRKQTLLLLSPIISTVSFMNKHSIIHIRLRQESIMRKRRKSKRKKGSFNKHRKKTNSVHVKKPQQYGTMLPVIAVAPERFCIDNLDKVLIFLNETEQKCDNSYRKLLNINLDNVKQIDSYAISLLLSMLNRLSYKNISCWGSYPKSFEAKRYILESGFLDVMKSNIKKPSNKRIANRIFMIGKDSVDSHRIGQAVKESMVFITGNPDVFPPVYDDMLEISANSVEHANLRPQDKNWLVSITFEGDKVHYILTDTGLGILVTIKKRFSQRVKEAFSSKTDAQILHDVFHRKYQSITGEINRYKGLPIILESFDDGFISDLIVVTNNVYYDFETNKAKSLSFGYKGVMYSWTVSKANYDTWLNSLTDL